MIYSPELDKRIKVKAAELGLREDFMLTAVGTIAGLKHLGAVNVRTLHLELTYSYFRYLANYKKLLDPACAVPLTDETFQLLAKEEWSVLAHYATAASGDEEICQHHLEAANEGLDYLREVNERFSDNLFSLVIMDACQDEIREAERTLFQ